MSDDKKTVAQLAIELALQLYDIGRSTTGEAFAVEKCGPNIALVLKGSSRGLRAQLARAFLDRHARVANAGALSDALLVIEGMAQDYDAVDVEVRVARHRDGIVIDLGDPTGRAVEIIPGSWRVVDTSPVLFRRSQLTAPLPVPQQGGTLDELRDHINVSDQAWPQLVAWMVAALLPDRPCPILLATGIQGTAKSTTVRHVGAVIDPSAAPLRDAPEDAQEWAVAANGSRVIPLDNLSMIREWFSDALCRAVTGDGFARRQLYTDTELVVVQLRRALMMTSIDAGSLRGDLLDRVVAVELERIPDDRRREDSAIAAAFTEAQPRIIAGLYDTVAQVLAELPNVQPARLPRMADYGRILATVDHLLGTNGLATYLATGKALEVELVEGDRLAAAVRKFAVDEGHWRGPAALLHKLITPKGISHEDRSWPADGTRLSGQLKRITPALRSVGVTIDSGRSGREGRWISVTDEAQQPDQPSHPDQRPLGDADPAPGDAASVTERPNHHPKTRPGDASDAKSPSCSQQGQNPQKKTIRETASPASPATPPDDYPPDWPTDHDLEAWAAQEATT